MTAPLTAPVTGSLKTPTDGAGHSLVVRPDGLGDVVLAGPAVRAVAAGSSRVTLLAGPRGAEVGALLPGVDDVVVWSPPWIDPDPAPVCRAAVDAFVERLVMLQVDRAILLTSFHQSPLPTALLLRLAGVPWIVAMSEDYPGSLLDLRAPPTADIPEPERSLALVQQAGYRLPAGDDGRLALRCRPAHRETDRTTVVLHPGTSVPARAWPVESFVELVPLLRAEGHHVQVTGSAGETELCARVAAGGAVDLSGSTDVAALASVLAAADVVVAGNTGPAHVAAAVGTPVVSLFAPTVPAARWAPYRVAHVLLGDQAAPCRDTRATACPVPGHPCLSSVTPQDVLGAVDKLICEKEDQP